MSNHNFICGRFDPDERARICCLDEDHGAVDHRDDRVMPPHTWPVRGCLECDHMTVLGVCQNCGEAEVAWGGTRAELLEEAKA